MMLILKLQTSLIFRKTLKIKLFFYGVLIYYFMYCILPCLVVYHVIIHNVENIFRTKNNKNIDEYNKNISAYSFLISGIFVMW